MARRKEHYYASCVLGFSITQIIFGVICIILQVVLIVGRGRVSVIGHGIWSGLFVSHNQNIYY